MRANIKADKLVIEFLSFWVYVRPSVVYDGVLKNCNNFYRKLKIDTNLRLLVFIINILFKEFAITGRLTLFCTFNLHRAKF